MKKATSLLLASLFALSLLPAAPAFALTASGGFDVTVNLYSKCEFTTAPAGLALHYVSFQTTDSTNTQNFVLHCTNSLPYTLTLGTTTGTLVGLNYSLALVDGTGAASNGSGTGSGVNQTYGVKGTIASGQSGTCATPSTATTGTQTASVTGTTAGLGTACVASTTGAPHSVTITY